MHIMAFCMQNICSSLCKVMDRNEILFFMSYTIYLWAIAILLLALISAFLYKFYLGGFLALMLVYILCIFLSLVVLFSVKIFVIFFRKAQNFTTSAAASSFDSEFKPPNDFEEKI